MIWSIESYCRCGKHKRLNRNTRKKDLQCDCGGWFKPVLFNYTIDVALLGGVKWLIDELEYRASYEPLKGLDQLAGVPLLVSDPSCTCDEEEDVCTHCLDKYTELSGGDNVE